jgi:hypothetical protein
LMRCFSCAHTASSGSTSQSVTAGMVSPHTTKRGGHSACAHSKAMPLLLAVPPNPPQLAP